MKLISNETRGKKTYEVEVNEDLLIKAIENQEDIITECGKKLSHQTNYVGVASFNLEVDEYRGTSADFDVLYKKKHKRDMPLNILTHIKEQLNPEFLKNIEQDKQDIKNGLWDGEDI